MVHADYGGDKPAQAGKPEALLCHSIRCSAADPVDPDEAPDVVHCTLTCKSTSPWPRAVLSACRV
jgi:hypothetical protein